LGPFVGVSIAEASLQKSARRHQLLCGRHPLPALRIPRPVEQITLTQ
jgi:hypothetical protein